MQTTEFNQKLKNYPKQQLAPFLLSNQNFNNGRQTLKPLDHTKSTFGKTVRDSNDYNPGKSSPAVPASVSPYQLMLEEMQGAKASQIMEQTMDSAGFRAVKNNRIRFGNSSGLGDETRFASRIDENLGTQSNFHHNDMLIESQSFGGTNLQRFAEMNHSMDNETKKNYTQASIQARPNQKTSTGGQSTKLA